MKELIEFLENIQIGREECYKVGFTTYNFYRIDANTFEVDCLRDSWLKAEISLNNIKGDNPMEFLHNLNWG